MLVILREQLEESKGDTPLKTDTIRLIEVCPLSVYKICQIDIKLSVYLQKK